MSNTAELAMRLTRFATLVPFVVLAVSAAHAQEATQTFAGEVLSVRTRAEVRAELDQARLAGTLERRNYAYVDYRRADEAPSTLTRAEVLAEFERARVAGELERRNYAHHRTPAPVVMAKKAGTGRSGS
jgi:hypothetical protein